MVLNENHDPGMCSSSEATTLPAGVVGALQSQGDEPSGDRTVSPAPLRLVAYKIAT